MGLNFRDKAWILLGILWCSSLIYSVKAMVTYDRRAVIINGQRRILLSGSIHYPRSTPEVLFNFFNTQKIILFLIYEWLSRIFMKFFFFSLCIFSAFLLDLCPQSFSAHGVFLVLLIVYTISLQILLFFYFCIG